MDVTTYVVLTKVRNGLVRRIIHTLYIHDLPVSLKEVHMYNTILTLVKTTYLRR